MTKHMQKMFGTTAKLILALNLVIYSSFGLSLNAYATEMPNSSDLKNTIIENAQAKTSQINAQPTSAPVAETNTDVTNTGDNTTVNNGSNSDSTTVVDNQNNTQVDQTTNASANTGYNQAQGNISINGGGAGIIETGNASVNVVGVVDAGSNTTQLSGGNGGAGSNSGIANTGDGVTVSSSANSTQYRIVKNGNSTIINQATNADANTGYNNADGNIAINGGPAGVIVTGNASTNVDYLVTANGNVTIIGGTGGNGPGSGASIILANSGNYGNFNNSANSVHYTTVTNSNRAILSQMCGYGISREVHQIDMNGCVANTGGNTSNGAIAFGADAGVIQTGDAVVNVEMNASANNNNTYIANGSGGSSSSTDVFNTGDNVEVNSSANSSDTTTVGNYNDARVTQTVNASADTGHNTANGNISFGGRAGVIITGDATVNVIMTAEVNKNTTVVSDPSASLNGSVNGSSIVNTGDDVTINTSSNNTNVVEVINVNVLELSQQVNSYTNTGNNTADGNIGSGGGRIVTGDATTTVNMDVTANSNCTLIGGGDPSDCPQLGSDPESPSVTPTETPSTTTNQGGTGGTYSSSSSSSGASVAGTTSPAAILGAVLPATGPEAGMMILSFAIAGVLGGAKLRKFKQN
ncbi:hypothetical protein A3H83_03240 [Candidatus Roizmanbacteria bacterium RIFCSPLOWO2_02_FULL_39_8]|uniref:Uncharacterized protein n=1 Tax=Candidatus Roizmanbacteria bacterium RIFCSPHIGHO2_01_FULL_39_24 TaxID=1802032 RepID=A0A1F7GH10_9BACT|nr:MAG: hypothetical protein A2799_03100 [Candidatus Roizmanbacteria bacterium RIFCSPHIGHO2_01_FULL_39_24]OGK57542.1 MAG: hypothetical protein A3H83_03240 [Candidatus Roizmanbacteria bacterium RIFCSPLOWO2_02_FULL_39_8]